MENEEIPFSIFLKMLSKESVAHFAPRFIQPPLPFSFEQLLPLSLLLQLSEAFLFLEALGPLLSLQLLPPVLFLLESPETCLL